MAKVRGARNKAAVAREQKEVAELHRDLQRANQEIEFNTQFYRGLLETKTALIDALITNQKKLKRQVIIGYAGFGGLAVLQLLQTFL